MVSSLCKNAVHDADNIECLHDWCKKRFDGMGEQLNGFFKEVSCPLLHETFASSINAQITLIVSHISHVGLRFVHAAEWIRRKYGDL